MDLNAAKAAASVAAETAPDLPTVPAMVPGRVAHIDGDSLAYGCAGNDETPFGLARQRLLERIEQFRLYSGAERVLIHNTAPGSDKGKRFHIGQG